MTIRKTRPTLGLEKFNYRIKMHFGAILTIIGSLVNCSSLAFFLGFPIILSVGTTYAWPNPPTHLGYHPKSFETARRFGSQTKVIIFILGFIILIALAISFTWFSGPTIYSEFLSIRISSGATSGKVAMYSSRSSLSFFGCFFAAKTKFRNVLLVKIGLSHALKINFISPCSNQNFQAKSGIYRPKLIGLYWAFRFGTLDTLDRRNSINLGEDQDQTDIEADRPWIPEQNFTCKQYWDDNRGNLEFQFHISGIQLPQNLKKS